MTWISSGTSSPLWWRPRGRRVKSKPRRAAELFAHRSSPKGVPRCTHVRKAATSASETCHSGRLASEWKRQSGNGECPFLLFFFLRRGYRIGNIVGADHQRNGPLAEHGKVVRLPLRGQSSQRWLRTRQLHAVYGQSAFFRTRTPRPPPHRRRGRRRRKTTRLEVYFTTPRTTQQTVNRLGTSFVVS
jgi:hypothetical protein